MKRHQQILVPVDLDRVTSEVAIKTALAHAGSAEAIEVLHVVSPSAWEMPTAVIEFEGEQLSLPEYLRLRARRELDALIADILPDDAQRVPRKVAWGHVASTILEELCDGGHRMVVVATHGREGLAHWLHGSVAEKLSRCAPCPVLTVRVPAGAHDDRRIPELRGAGHE